MSNYAVFNFVTVLHGLSYKLNLLEVVSVNRLYQLLGLLALFARLSSTTIRILIDSR